MTKIDDLHGTRNQCALKRQHLLWFVPDGSMYVYYRPTHFRPLTDAERARERDEILKRAEALSRQANGL